jgi:hypothetical protein
MNTICILYIPLPCVCVHVCVGAGHLARHARAGRVDTREHTGDRHMRGSAVGE